MKKSIRRERPSHTQSTAYRRYNLRGMEKGTLAMPSGDSAQATLWCALIYFSYGGPGLLFMLCVLPAFVSFARVYYHCHYVGDVLVGAAVGLLVGFVGYYNFQRYLDLFS